MSRLWNSKQWRRLSYAAMSLLVVWHTLAMVVAPMPDNAITDPARVLFEPYLTLFRIENIWNFFAPNVRVDPTFRYVVEDASGQFHTISPLDKLSRFHPSEIWIKDWYIGVIDDAETFGDTVAATLCREHAALHPVRITLLEIDQTDFSPEDQRSGKHPSDPEFADEKTLATVECPDE